MNTLVRAAVALSFVALSGCASLITGGELIRPGEPTGGLQVRNVSRTNSIDVVVVSDCNALTYGLNRLPSGYRIPPGGNYTFTLSAGCWDVGAGEILSQNTWTEGYTKVTVTPGRTTTVQSR